MATTRYISFIYLRMYWGHKFIPPINDVGFLCFPKPLHSLTDDYWQHIRFRHPEIQDDPTSLMSAVEKPDETYHDNRGGVHVLKRLDRSHFIVVIYEFENDIGFIRTAYITSDKRKLRRYRSR